MRTLRTLGLGAIGVMAAALGLSAAFAVDAEANDGRVTRNVTLAGRDVSGLTQAQLEAVARDLAARYPRTDVVVQADEGPRLVVKASELGLSVDERGTVAASLRVGREGSLPGRIWSWAWSLVAGDREAPVRVGLSESSVYAAVARLDRGRTPAVEPGIALRDGRFVAVPGRKGRGIDAADIIAALPGAAVSGGTVTVTVERGEVDPRFGMARARAVAARAEEVTRVPLAVAAGDVSATVPTRTLRSWLAAAPDDRDLQLVVDDGKVLADLEELLPRAGTPAVDAGFRVTASGVVITPSRSGTGCCDENAPLQIRQALEQRPSGPVRLGLRTVQPRRTDEAARRLGVVEKVSGYTTRHKSGEPRVDNIHRIADLVRGQVIEPGKTFSVNGFVGPRTRAKGFVAAPVIQDGLFEEDVGGGISQFATTLFKAAVDAGLEFAEYQSHSIYISRYPYGVEATLNYPHPDVKIRNPTPYGVLIWPTYTASTITVTLYSTRHYQEVRLGGQSKSTDGVCTVVTTERIRVGPDGTSKTDTIRARYRPGEGIDCSGRRTTRTTEGQAATTTTSSAGPSATTSTPTATTTAPP